MDTIGVIGAGNIGSSLSHSLILANKKVVLIDISDQILSNAKSIIKKNLRFSHMFLKQKEPFPMSLTDNITFDTSLDRLKECDFIIENITEDYEAKKAVYLQLNDVCNKDAIIAVRIMKQKKPYTFSLMMYATKMLLLLSIHHVSLLPE